MRKGQFTEEQILGVLHEADAGRPVVELARAHGITTNTAWPCSGRCSRLLAPI
jgi:hypothetical protein